MRLGASDFLSIFVIWGRMTDKKRSTKNAHLAMASSATVAAERTDAAKAASSPKKFLICDNGQSKTQSPKSKIHEEEEKKTV